jgi:hypothetical protein
MRWSLVDWSTFLKSLLNPYANGRVLAIRKNDNGPPADNILELATQSAIKRCIETCFVTFMRTDESCQG